MKLILPTLIAAAAASPITTLEQEFEQWKQTHEISLQGRENHLRFQHWLRNHDFVTSHNQRYATGQETYTVSMNAFAAMPTEEFAEKYLQKPWTAGDGMKFTEFVNDQLVTEYQCPTSYRNQKGGAPSSYSTKGSWVTSVKNQGSCGSCWTFGAGAAIEGAMCKGGKQNCKSWNGVSTQQMVDCCSYNNDLNPYDNHGCNGGFQSNAMRCVIMQGGIDSWDSYSYQSGSSGKEYSCNYSSRNSVGTISSCGRLGKANDENLLVDMIYHEGVTTIAIDASGPGFQLYSGGVYTSNTCSSTRLNHAVTATGYGSSGGDKYFEVKNSWGSSWGDKGYILIARNGKNMCGVAAEGQYAIL